MDETVSIQWFPGHMTKTRRLMEKDLKLVDIVVELTDARIPFSSRNPEIDRILGNKPRLLLLNKCDAADEAVNRRWCEYYKEKGITALPTDCRSGRGLKAFLPAVREVLKDQLARLEEKGMGGRPIRMMVVGIPNVGKSSFINRMAGSRVAKVEDRPGVTRGKQWAKLESGAELLDMPGVLWPKFDDQEVAEHLAFTGAIKDDVMDIEMLAMRLLEVLCKDYLPLVIERYKVTAEEVEGLDGYDLLELVARKRGMLMAGGAANTERAAITVLDEFRSGKIGSISLEKPEDFGPDRPRRKLEVPVKEKKVRRSKAYQEGGEKHYKLRQTDNFRSEKKPYIKGFAAGKKAAPGAKKPGAVHKGPGSKPAKGGKPKR